ncbi:MAG: SURF1 family cytochrome oxidase biogenesis protein [Aestuariivirga sp.]
MRVWPVIVTAAVGIAILCTLGTWQIIRMGEKAEALAKLEEHFDQPPISLAEAMQRAERGEDIEYLKVEARGTIDAARTLLKISTRKGMPAFEMIRPLATPEGNLVLVDDGLAYSPTATNQASAEFSVIGILRKHDKGRGAFDYDNDPAANVWTWWDIPAMLKAASLPEGTKPATFILQRLPSNDEKSEPWAIAPQIELANNHLSYAITWFSLAAVLAGVAGLVVLQNRER